MRNKNGIFYVPALRRAIIPLFSSPESVSGTRRGKFIYLLLYGEKVHGGNTVRMRGAANQPPPEFLSSLSFTKKFCAPRRRGQKSAPAASHQVIGRALARQNRPPPRPSVLDYSGGRKIHHFPTRIPDFYGAGFAFAHTAPYRKFAPQEREQNCPRQKNIK